MNNANDLFDAQINIKRLIWMMDDDTFNCLQSLMRQHISLVKAALEPNLTQCRKKELNACIAKIKSERDNLIKQFRESVENGKSKRD